MAKIIHRGRLMFPADSSVARQYAERNLTTLYSRRARISAVLGRASSEGVESEAATGRPPLPDDVAPLLEDLAVARDWLFLRDYPDTERERSILFTFQDGRPAQVIKLRRRGSEGASLRREAEVLTLARELASAGIAATLPEAKVLATTTSHEVLVLAALPGRPLLRILQESVRGSVGQAPTLAALGRWLGTLQRETFRDGAPVVHGDFWPRNVLVEGDRITGVVDWESAAPAGSPTRDLFTMAVLFHQTPPLWARESRQLERAFRDGSPLRRYFEEWCRASGTEWRELRTSFDQFAEEAERSGKETNQWQRTVPWEMLRSLIAGRSVFSG